MTPEWSELTQELDRWRVAGRRATLWCRDDDAFERTPALDKLLALSEANNIPMALAVIPTLTGDALAAWLRGCTTATVVVHGYAHISHAPVGAKRAEFGAHRPVEDMLTEIRLGHQRIEQLFGKQSRPVFVPPWNRISQAVTHGLSGIGIGGLSTYAARHSATPANSLRQTNCHVDVIDWKKTRGFIGEKTALSSLTNHLQARRLDAVDGDEPTGILTHHKDHDEACWAFLQNLWSITGSTGVVDWLNVSEVLWPS